jgi:hypothetical protein
MYKLYCLPPSRGGLHQYLPRLFLFAIWMAGIASSASVFGLTLTWRAPESGPAVSGYYLYMYDTTWPSPRRIKIGDVTRHKLTGLVPGRTYSFYLTAYNQHGLESDPSNTFVYEVPVTGPIVTGSSLGGYGMMITWDSEEGMNYVVVWKSSFTETNWKVVSPVITAIGPYSSWVIGKSSELTGFYGVQKVD